MPEAYLGSSHCFFLVISELMGFSKALSYGLSLPPSKLEEKQAHRSIENPPPVRLLAHFTYGCQSGLQNAQGSLAPTEQNKKLRHWIRD